MLKELFGPPRGWPRQDLIGVSNDFDPELVWLAYQCGVFPMPMSSMQVGAEPTMGWWSPLRRGVIMLDDLRVSRSMRRSARRYYTTIDTAFDQVLARCSDPDRPGGWIDDSIRAAYTQLHRQGRVHSVETWDAAGRLVGGLYGVSVGALFAGESMFHAPDGRDASKVALLRLVAQLRARPDAHGLVDVQWCTPHLARLGATQVQRARYLGLLSAALDAPEVGWPPPASSRMDGAETLRMLDESAHRGHTGDAAGSNEEGGDAEGWISN